MVRWSSKHFSANSRQIAEGQEEELEKKKKKKEKQEEETLPSGMLQSEGE